MAGSDALSARLARKEEGMSANKWHLSRPFGGWGDSSLPERWLDALADFGPWLPMTLTQGHPSALVRLLGLLWFFVWCVPVFALCLLPMLALILATIITDTIRGE